MLFRSHSHRPPTDLPPSITFRTVLAACRGRQQHPCLPLLRRCIPEAARWPNGWKTRPAALLVDRKPRINQSAAGDAALDGEKGAALQSGRGFQCPQDEFDWRPRHWGLPCARLLSNSEHTTRRRRRRRRRGGGRRDEWSFTRSHQNKSFSSFQMSEIGRAHV